MNINIALIGNPSSGLTTLFNQMTGGVQHTGIFSTNTNKTKEGPVKGHKNIGVIELPGTYSLSAYTVDDLSTRDILLHGKPDVLVNILDATNLERNLYLTLQLLELEIPMVLAFNMMDEVRKNEISIDLQTISDILTVPVIPISASKNQGIHDLIHYAIETAHSGHIPSKLDFCSGHIHTAIHAISHLIENEAADAGLPLRFATTKVVEGDQVIIENLKLQAPELDIIGHIIDDMEKHLHTDREAAMADMRYAFIDKLRAKTIKTESIETLEHIRSVKIDRLLTHRIFAIPIFLGIMFLVFYLTFEVIGKFLRDWLALGIDWIILEIGKFLTESDVSPAFQALIVNGVLTGIGSILSFLPIIAVLFFFLSILEDSGYIPRVAFVMDKLLRKIGLSGRSIVPMLIGFGCSVPAIMATRSLPSKRDRQLTIALIPFMSCSAKLPIYAIFTAAFFSSYQGLVMTGIYLTGILVAITCALIFKLTIYKGDPVPFVMVIPSYRFPSLISVGLRMWENVKGFIKKAFTVILLATIVIWFLQSFDFGLNMVSSSEHSILASIGRAIAPIFAPLGFGDWRAATALITGMSAKEAVVSTMAVLTGTTGTASLDLMLNEIFTPISAFSFMVFCLLYMPCVATLTAIKRELGGLRYALLITLFQTVVAWLVAFLIYQSLNFFFN
jgi:ferrous iron transport protein B